VLTFLQRHNKPAIHGTFGRRTLMLKRLITLGIGAAAVLAMALPAQAQQEFKIGIVLSLSGGFVAAAKDTMDGVEGWEKAHGGLAGKKIVYEKLDDETNPVTAANAFRRLAGDKDVKLIYLFINSSAALAVKTLASEFKVPIVSGGAADALGTPAEPYLFKVAPAVRDFMRVLAQYAKDKGYKKIALLNMTDAFGQSEAKNFKELAPQFGLEIVAAETMGVEDTNVNAQWAKIRAANPDMIYDGAASRAAIIAYKAYKQLGMTTPIVVTQAAISKAFFDAIGGPKEADGLLVPIQLGNFGAAAGGEAAKFYGELQTAMGRTPPYFATFGFDVGLITEAAVKNSDGSREGLRNALEAIKDLPGLNGPISYTKDDHTGQNYKSIAIGKLENGVSTLIK
jgi:branched-chain amino acid transport system substrate-binding protein